MISRMPHVACSPFSRKLLSDWGTPGTSWKRWVRGRISLSPADKLAWQLTKREQGPIGRAEADWILIGTWQADWVNRLLVRRQGEGTFFKKIDSTSSDYINKYLYVSKYMT